MKRPTFWPLHVVPLVIVGTVPLWLTPTVTPALTAGRRTVLAEPVLLSGEALGAVPDLGPGVALILGGSGTPIPPESGVQLAFDNYFVPKGFGDYTPQIVFTPEGLSPIYSGIKSLPLDTSVSQGVTILNSAIKSQIEAGNNVVVGGVSQSATIDSLEMHDIVANNSLGFQPTPDQLAFMMVGDPSNPNGGLLERFDLPDGSHPSIPSLGVTFSGATPADTGFPTDIYSLEYDGFADFPRYTMNFVSDLNAFAGILFVHGLYVGGVTEDQIQNAIVLPTSAGYDGGTTYYMMPTAQLPLAQLIQEVAGKPFADLLEPDLRVLANLGYGTDPDIGWSETPANVPTPLGLFPSLDSDQFNTILQALGSGAQQGMSDFMADLSDPSTSSMASIFSNPFAAMTAAVADPPSFTDIVNALTSVVSQAYSVLLPTADIGNALVTTLPAYDLSLFTDYLQAGDLVNAIGLPMAATTGLLTMAGGIELMVVEETASSIQSTLAGVFG